MIGAKAIIKAPSFIEIDSTTMKMKRYFGEDDDGAETACGLTPHI